MLGKIIDHKNGQKVLLWHKINIKYYFLKNNCFCPLIREQLKSYVMCVCLAWSCQQEKIEADLILFKKVKFSILPKLWWKIWVITLKFSDPSLKNNLRQKPDEREKTVSLDEKTLKSSKSMKFNIFIKKQCIFKPLCSFLLLVSGEFLVA